MTAEGQADNAYFDFLVSACSLDESGQKVFKNFDDYIEKSREPLSVKLAEELSALIFGNVDFIKDLPEKPVFI